MLRIHIEEVKGHIKRLEYINSIPLDEIVWMKEGQQLNIPQKTIDEFELTGLSNKDFISTNYYLKDMPPNQEIFYAEEFLTALSSSLGWGDLKAIETLQKGLDKLK